MFCEEYIKYHIFIDFTPLITVFHLNVLAIPAQDSNIVIFKVPARICSSIPARYPLFYSNHYLSSHTLS